MKQILIVALVAMSIIGCNNNKSNTTTTDSAATDSTATEDMTRKFGNNSGMPDSSLDKPDSAINRSDTPRMTN